MPDATPDAEPRCQPPAPHGGQPEVEPFGALPAVPFDCRRLAARTGPLRLGPHPPSQPLDGVCAADVSPSNYTRPPAAAGPEQPYALHVLAAGAGEAVAPDAPGEVQVHVRPDHRPAVLVLAAAAPVTWRITLHDEARVAGIFTTGPAPQAVRGSPVAVEALAADHFCDFGDGWEAGRHHRHNQHRVMIGAIREAFGHGEASFQGCGSAVRFEVPYADCPPVDPIPIEPAPNGGDWTIPGCEGIVDESLQCLWFDAHGVDLVGLDTGRSCAIDRRLAFNIGQGTAAWLDRAVWTCTPRLGLTRLRLDTLTLDVPEVLCDLVVEDGDTPLAVREAWMHVEIERFADGAALVGGLPIQATSVQMNAVRFSAADGILYGTLHSDSAIERYDLEARSPLEPLELQDFDGLVEGFDVLPDVIVVRTTGGLRTFDRATGADLDWLPHGEDASSGGIACRVGPVGR